MIAYGTQWLAYAKPCFRKPQSCVRKEGFDLRNFPLNRICFQPSSAQEAQEPDHPHDSEQPDDPEKGHEAPLTGRAHFAVAKKHGSLHGLCNLCRPFESCTFSCRTGEKSNMTSRQPAITTQKSNRFLPPAIIQAYGSTKHALQGLQLPRLQLKSSFAYAKNLAGPETRIRRSSSTVKIPRKEISSTFDNGYSTRHTQSCSASESAQAHHE